MGYIEQLAQMGAVGAVAGVLLWQSWRTQERMAKSLEDNNRMLVDIVKTTTDALNNNSDAMDRLTSTLEKRPCLQLEDHG
jgi:hypothetical protein